jgi:hypothetical protein
MVADSITVNQKAYAKKGDVPAIEGLFNSFLFHSNSFLSLFNSFLSFGMTNISYFTKTNVITAGNNGLLCLFLFLFSNIAVTQQGLRGATVARLTPEQKAACSNHVGVKDTFDLEGTATRSHFSHKGVNGISGQSCY